MSVRYFFVLASLAILFSCADPDVPTDDSIRSGTLPNGLSYLVKRHANPGGRILFRLVLNGGASIEEEGELGYSHLVEHLAWDGTARFPGDAIDRWLDTIGMNRGAMSSAFTSWRNVSYRLMIPSAKESSLDTAFSVLKDWTSAISFGADDIEREKLVVLEELRTTFGTERRLDDLHAGIEPDTSTPPRDDILGDYASLEAATPESLRRFWKRWYVPGLATIIVVGDADPDVIIQRIRDGFSDIRGYVPSAYSPVADDRYEPDSSVSIAQDPGVSGASGLMRWVFDVMPGSKIVGYRERKAIARIASMLETSLRRAAVGSEGILESAGVSFETYGAGQVGLDVRFTSATDKWKEAFALVAGVIGIKATQGFSSREHDFWRAARLTRESLYRDDFASMTSEDVLDLLENRATDGSSVPDDSFRKIELANSLALSGDEGANRDFKRLMAGRFPAIRLDFSSTDGEAVPTEEEVSALFEQEMKNPPVATLSPFPVLEPFAGKKFSPNGEIRKLSRDAVEINLKNGIRIFAARSGSETGKASLRAFSPGGSGLYPLTDYDSAVDSDDAFFFLAPGFGYFGAVYDVLARYSFSFNPWIRFGEEGIDASFPVAETQRFLAFLVDCMADMDMTEKDVRSFSNWRGSASGNYGDPESDFFSRVDSIAWSGHRTYAHRVSGPSDPSRSAEIASERFLRPSDFTFVFSGDFDLEAFVSEASLALGSLPGSPVRESRAPTDIPAAPGGLSIEQRDGLEPKGWNTMIWDLPLDDTWKSAEKLELLSLCIGNELFEFLRKSEGGIYSVEAYPVTVRSDPPQGRFYAEFQCDPERAIELREKTLALMHRIGREGVGAKTLDTAFAARQTLMEEAVSDSERSAEWYANVRYRDFNPSFGYREQPGLPSRAEILGLMRKTFSRKPAVKATLLPAETGS